MRTTYYPMRTVAGPVLPVRSITVLAESAASNELDMQYEVVPRDRLADAVDDARYGRYLPHPRIGRYVVRPAGGSSRVLPPAHVPFAADAPLTSLFARSAHRDQDPAKSRALSVTLQLRLADPATVGGICFSGLPSLPAAIDEHGRTEANFGLPREVRLTCSPAATAAAGFIDAELSTSVQETISHSGLHHLATEPVRAEYLQLHLSDYPMFRAPDFRPAWSFPWEVPESDTDPVCFGFVLPFLWVVGHTEGTRHTPTVPVGLLGVGAGPGARGRYPEHETRRGHRDSREYAAFTAASVVSRQQRSYTFADRSLLTESFVSEPTEPGEQVVLHLQQADEYPRCVAGLRIEWLFLPDDELLDRPASAGPLDREELEATLRRIAGLPDDVRFCRRTRVRVFAVDPPEGASPVLVDRTGKYATLLAEQVVDELTETALSPLLRGLRFVRPTTASWFAVELTNVDDEPGQFVVRSLSLLRSAHASVQSLPAREQRVRAVHFRLVGADLADDYAALGGFTLSVERLVAGETKEVLLRAGSLLDLLHLGIARVHGNMRRPAVEDEIAVQGAEVGENREERLVDSRAEGWRRTETGGKPPPADGWDAELAADAAAYETFGNQEVRTHTRLLYPDAADLDENTQWLAGGAYLNALGAVFNAGEALAGVTGGDGLVEQFAAGPVFRVPDEVELHEGFARYWAGLVGDLTTEQLRVHGVHSFQQSPYGIVGVTAEFVKDLIDATGSAVTLFTDLLAGNLDVVTVPGVGDIPDIPRLLDRLKSLGDVGMIGLLLGTAALGPGQAPLAAIPFMNGLNLSLSGQPGGLGVTGTPSAGLLPGVVETAAAGSAGQVALSASRTGAAFAKQRAGAYDHLQVRSRVVSGVSSRRVERRAVPAAAAQRVRGAEVMWQGRLVDIVTGTLPVDLVIQATASRMYRTSDEALVVRLNGGSADVTADVWFDVVEEPVRDDH